MNREEMPNLQIAYIEHIVVFDEYYSLLLNRYDRFCQLRKQDPYSLDTNTYFDMIIVQLRAMLLDDKKKDGILENYTFQSILRLMDNNKEQFGRLKKLLATPVFTERTMKSCTVEQALSQMANKSICHYNNYNREDRVKFEWIQILRKEFIVNAIIKVDHF